VFCQGISPNRCLEEDADEGVFILPPPFEIAEPNLGGRGTSLNPTTREPFPKGDAFASEAPLLTFFGAIIKFFLEENEDERSADPCVLDLAAAGFNAD
jgi:hypothetical protein